MLEDASKTACSHKANAIAWSIYVVLCILTLLVLGWCVLVKGLVGVVIADSNLDTWLHNLDDAQRAGIIGSSRVAFLGRSYSPGGR